MQNESASKKPIIINGVDTTVGKLPIVMTVSETAEALRMSEASIRRAISQGEIPSTELAGRTYVVSGKLLASFDDAEAKRITRLAKPRKSDGGRQAIAGRWLFCTPPR
jgi:excisionase family DNA binding protein